MVLIWIIGTLAGVGLLYLAIPLLTAAFLFVLRALLYIVLAYVAYRVLLFLVFLATYDF